MHGADCMLLKCLVTDYDKTEAMSLASNPMTVASSDDRIKVTVQN